MKKIIFSLVVLSLLIQLPVFAAETEQEAMSATLADQSAGASVNQPAATPVNQPVEATIAGAGKLGNPPPPVNQIVLTNDGSVILFMGWRLMKYDASLNLVKDVRIPFPKFPADNKLTPKAAKADQPVAAELQEKAI